MKVKKIKINLKSLEDVGKEMTKVMRAVESGESVSPKRHEIVFSDFAALRSFLTPKRLELIQVNSETRSQFDFTIGSVSQKRLCPGLPGLKATLRSGHHRNSEGPQRRKGQAGSR